MSTLPATIPRVKPSPRPPPPGQLSGTLLIHGDTHVGPEVTPSISVSTTFRTVPKEDEPDPSNPDDLIYSRLSTSISLRVDQILDQVNHGYSVTYSSGLAAGFAALVHYKPKRIAIGPGYKGNFNIINLFKSLRFEDTPVIGLDEEYKEGDLCFVETPVNPTGEARNLQHYADKIHKVGGKLLVDATLGPPPLQYPFKFGVDCIYHSGSKYFGGHSDLLSGILIVKTAKERDDLVNDRTNMGNISGSLETWLLLRSLRTLHFRVPRQASNATTLAQWLHKVSLTPAGQEFDGVPGGVVVKVWHTSLQPPDSSGFDPKKQMEGGFSPTFAIRFAKPGQAYAFPYELEYFVPATSLGGVESLIEHLVRVYPDEDPHLIRLSIGAEEPQDLIDDLRRGIKAVAPL